MAAPVYQIKLQGRPGADGIRNLRSALKTLLRSHHLRCLDARMAADSFQTPSIGASKMYAGTDLDRLRNWAAAARRGGFGFTGFRLDGTNGEYRLITNKAANKMNGERWAAMCTDAMIGWQRVVKGQSPTYVLGWVADGYQPPERSELGEMPTDSDSKDVWTSASWLPFWNLESREVRIFHAANDGSRQAVANVVECYVTNCAVRTDQINYDPLTELAVDSYESKHGRRIYFPVFETIFWIDRPAALQRVIPPPVCSWRRWRRHRRISATQLN
jgi:hypothetical protein